MAHLPSEQAALPGGGAGSVRTTPGTAGAPAPSGSERDVRLAGHLRNLGRMYPVLAHDLHAYLNTIVLNLEILRRAADAPEADARIARCADLIGSELASLDRMLKAVVGQTRLSEGISGRFDVRAVVEEIAVLFDSYGRHERIGLRADLIDVPLAVQGERDAVKHALVAFVMHAADRIAGGGAMSLELGSDRRRATFSIRASGGTRGAASAPGSREPDAPTPSCLEDGSAPPDWARHVLERHGARIQSSDAAAQASIVIELPLVSHGD